MKCFCILQLNPNSPPSHIRPCRQPDKNNQKHTGKLVMQVLFACKLILLISLMHKFSGTWERTQSQRWLSLEDLGCLGLSHGVTEGRTMLGRSDSWFSALQQAGRDQLDGLSTHAWTWTVVADLYPMNFGLHRVWIWSKAGNDWQESWRAQRSWEDAPESRNIDDVDGKKNYLSVYLCHIEIIDV